MEKEKRPTWTVPICKDFVRGRCLRTEIDCRFVHPLPAMTVENTPEGDVVPVCIDFIRQRCSRGSGCKFLHPPPGIMSALMEGNGLKFGPGMPNPIEMRLHDSPPSFLSPAVSRDLVNLSPGHWNGPHPSTPPREGPVPMGTPLGMRMRPALEVCRDFLRGRCVREEPDCRFAHTKSTTSGDSPIVIVCQDFLKARCERDTCRYFHPPDHLRSRIIEIPSPVHNAPPAVPSGLPPPPLPHPLLQPNAPLTVTHSPPPPGLPQAPHPGPPASLSMEKANAAAYHAAYNAYAASLFEQQTDAKRIRLEEESLGLAFGGSGFPGGLGAPLGDPLAGPQGEVAMAPPSDPYDSPFGHSQSHRLRKSSLDSLRLLEVAFPGVPGVPGVHGMNSFDHIQHIMGHPPRLSPGIGSPGTIQDNFGQVRTCRDFLRGRCNRPVCRFAHPDPNVHVSNDQVTICRDATRGDCKRDHCRFYHPKNTSSPSPNRN